MRVDSCSHHLMHPFSFKNSSVKLTVCEKISSLAWLLLLPLGVVPGIIGFYASAYVLKKKKIAQQLPLCKGTQSNLED